MSCFYLPTRGVTLAAVGFACALAACEPDGDAPEAVSEIDLVVSDAGEDGVTDLTDYDNSGEVEDHFDAGGVDLTLFEYVTEERPDGTIEDLVRVEGDLEFSVEDFERITADPSVEPRQYRTNNLVSNNRTIRVIGYTGGSNALTSTQRTALQWAVNNYNAVNIGLTFTLSFSTSTNADIVVYRQPNESGAGGVAGFPSGGRPYKWVQIFRGMDGYNTNTNEHVITHEIGHCLGFRHTDYFSRQSCGQNSNEGDGGVGAVYIPGTPSGYDAGSVMLACFGSNEDGEFGYYDRVALEYLY